MNEIDNNLNRDKILKINDEIINVAVATNFDCETDKQKSRKILAELIKKRKRIFKEGESA